MSSAISALPGEVRTAPGAPAVLTVPAPADPVAWAAEHRAPLRSLLDRHGALLVRGLGLAGVHQVTEVFGRLGSGLMTEREAFAARSRYADGVYSSATWPPNQPMCMHHELSYTAEPPGLLLFACLTAPETGGITGVADAAAVLDALPADLVARFEQTGWLLERTYNDEIGASWQDSFGTDDPAAVEAYCRASGIEATWQADGGLRTRQRRPAVVRSPLTGQRCWFNQVAFLSEWTLAPEIREYLVDMYGEDALPFTTRFGDGEPVGPDVVATINEVYEAHTRREPWRAGDLMLVDNVRTAHSREAYTGEREVLVGMSDPVRPDGAVAEGAR